MADAENSSGPEVVHCNPDGEPPKLDLIFRGIGPRIKELLRAKGVSTGTLPPEVQGALDDPSVPLPFSTIDKALRGVGLKPDDLIDGHGKKDEAGPAL